MLPLEVYPIYNLFYYFYELKEHTPISHDINVKVLMLWLVSVYANILNDFDNEFFIFNSWILH